MKALNKVLSVLLILTLALSLGVSALAESVTREHRYKGDDTIHTDTSQDDPQYLNDIAGTATDIVSMKKFLIVPDGVDVPNVTFNFAISAGAAVSASTSDNPVFQVIAGDDEKATNRQLPKFVVDDTETWKADTAANNQAGTISFKPTDTTLYSAVQTGDVDVARTAADRKTGQTAQTGVQLDNGRVGVENYGEKYVKKHLNISFAGVEYYEPGIYRYIITENAASPNPSGVKIDDDVDRVLDVYVIDKNDGSGDLEIKNIVMHKGAGVGNDGTGTKGQSGAYVNDPNVKIGTDMGSNDVATEGAELDDKTDGFTNEYKPYHLVFKKQVWGNQASRDKFFKFTVNITGLAANAEYKVSYNNNVKAKDAKGTDVYGNAVVSIPAYPNQATTQVPVAVTQPAKLTAGASGEISATFYLQHGQWIAILGLPADAVYSVTEEAEDYKPLAGGTQEHLEHTGKVENYQNLTNGKLSTQDAKKRADNTDEANDAVLDRVVYTSYLNIRDGIIPTGILTVIGPAVAVILLAVAGLTIVLLGKRRRKGSVR